MSDPTNASGGVAVAAPADGAAAPAPLVRPAAGSLAIPSATARANPFQALGLLLKAVADALEVARADGQAPCWVRIVRLRRFCQPVAQNDALIAGLVSKALGLLITAVASIQKLTLTAEDLLRQGDSVKALFEVSADLLKEVAKPEFFNSITAVVGTPEVKNTPLSSLGGVVDEVSTWVARVPRPEDLQAIGAQVYRLLAIQQLPTTTADSHIDLAGTGKLRLIAWGLGKPVAPLAPKGNPDTTFPFWFATRRVVIAGAEGLPQKSIGQWTGNDGQPETVFAFDYAAPNATKDIDEAKKILRLLGYYDAEPPAGIDDEMAVRLRRFQHINGLPISGELDNPTINAMLDLHYDVDPLKGRLQRAKPYDAKALGGFDDTKHPS